MQRVIESALDGPYSASTQKNYCKNQLKPHNLLFKNSRVNIADINKTK